MGWMAIECCGGGGGVGAGLGPGWRGRKYVDIYHYTYYSIQMYFRLFFLHFILTI